METIERLKTLVATPGISGNEKYISQFLKEAYAPYCDEILYDNLGSIYALKKGTTPKAPRVMINAHMDELGFIVRKIQENGTLLALSLGKTNGKALLGQKVKLTTRNAETFFGVILAQDKSDTVLNKENAVLLDLGFSSAEEAAAVVQLGDMVTFASEFFTSGNQEYWYAPNWNGRLSVSQTIDLLVALANETLPFDLYIGCTVQEQVGTRGAQTAANLVAPDLAIMLDTQQAWDYQKDPVDKQGVVGQGPLLTYYDPSVLPNRLLLATAKQVCDQQELMVQPYYSMEGSDAGWINKLRTGCPTLLLGQAVRNLDAGIQSASRTDYLALQTALQAFVRQLTNEQITAFKEENR